MKPSILAVLCVLAASTPPGSRAAETASPATIQVEQLRKEAAASVRSDIETIRKSDPNPRNTATLERILDALSQSTVPTHGTINNVTSATLSRSVEYSGASEGSRRRITGFIQATQQASEARAEADRNTAREILRQAIAAKDPRQLDESRDQLDKLRDFDNRTFDQNLSKQLASASSLAGNFSSLRRAVARKSWTDVYASYSLIQKALNAETSLLTKEEGAAVLAELSKELGVCSEDELQQALDESLQQLLDDSNQDKLAEVQERILQCQALASSTALVPSNSTLANRWNSLSKLANAFTAAVTTVRDGGEPHFSPTAWTDESYGQAPLLPKHRMEQLLADYKVKVPAPDGSTRWVRMRLDPAAILGEVQSLKDLANAMPDFRRAARQASATSSGSTWSSALAMLGELADGSTKLESGDHFLLTSESRGPVPLDHMPDVNSKIVTLQREFQIAVLRRVLPGSEPPPDTTAFRTHLLRLVAEARKTGKLDTILTLNQIAGYFLPGQPLLVRRDESAIRCYLTGIHQDDAVGEPTLAVCFLLRASLHPSDYVPLADIKKRLEILRHESPEEYRRGVEASMATGLESVITSESSPRALAVPGAP